MLLGSKKEEEPLTVRLLKLIKKLNLIFWHKAQTGHLGAREVYFQGGGHQFSNYTYNKTVKEISTWEPPAHSQAFQILRDQEQ